MSRANPSACPRVTSSTNRWAPRWLCADEAIRRHAEVLLAGQGRETFPSGTIRVGSTGGGTDFSALGRLVTCAAFGAGRAALAAVSVAFARLWGTGRRAVGNTGPLPTLQLSSVRRCRAVRILLACGNAQLLSFGTDGKAGAPCRTPGARLAALRGRLAAPRSRWRGRLLFGDGWRLQRDLFLRQDVIGWTVGASGCCQQTGTCEQDDKKGKVFGIHRSSSVVLTSAGARPVPSQKQRKASDCQRASLRLPHSAVQIPHGASLSGCQTRARVSQAKIGTRIGHGLWVHSLRLADSGSREHVLPGTCEEMAGTCR